MKYSFPEKIIKQSFYLSVWVIEQFSDMKTIRAKADELANCQEGTLGKEISNCLKENNLNLVPGYESHDLKHTLLEFEMTPFDEIRMQAFMIGNGNWSIPSLAIFIFGALLLPNKWVTLRDDFAAGTRALPIKDWSIEKFADKQLDELREEVFNASESQPLLRLRSFSHKASFGIILGGLLGMAFSFPFLWSSNLADLVGAGFPFVAGAVLVVGGLINLTLLSRLPASS